MMRRATSSFRVGALLLAAGAAALLSAGCGSSGDAASGGTGSGSADAAAGVKSGAGAAGALRQNAGLQSAGAGVRRQSR